MSILATMNAFALTMRGNKNDCCAMPKYSIRIILPSSRTFGEAPREVWSRVSGFTRAGVLLERWGPHFPSIFGRITIISVDLGFVGQGEKTKSSSEVFE